MGRKGLVHWRGCLGEEGTEREGKMEERDDERAMWPPPFWGEGSGRPFCAPRGSANENLTLGLELGRVWGRKVSRASGVSPLRESQAVWPGLPGRGDFLVPEGTGLADPLRMPDLGRGGRAGGLGREQLKPGEQPSVVPFSTPCIFKHADRIC